MKTAGLRYLIIALVFCSASPFLCTAQNSEDLDQFINWISGSYTLSSNSETEVKSLCASRIWDEKKSGVWIYLESQGVESSNVMVQTIYFVSEITDGEFSLDRYELKTPEPQQGGCEQPNLFVGLSPFDLYYMKGCTIFFSYDGFQYAGMSNSGSCKKKNNDNEFIVSDFNLTVNDLTILDKRYNQNDEEIDSEEKIYTKNN